MIRRLGLAAGIALAIPTLAAGSPPGRPATPPRSGSRIVADRWRAPSNGHQRPIWPATPPNGTYRPQPPESVQIYDDPAAHGRTSDAVLNIAIPTMTVFGPAGRNAGTAVIVFPGGGFQKVFIDVEGVELCDWLTRLGITCIVSKYRVPGGNHFFDDIVGRQVTPAVPRALQDAQRTIRLVRAEAAALGVRKDRIGVLGMSAGGYLVAQTSNLRPAYRPVDAIDHVSSRPDFAIALYPGHICRDGRAFDPTLKVSRAAPPTFIAQAWDDATDPVCNSLLYAGALDRAGVSTEVHLFARGGHAIALRHAREPVGQWAALAERWMRQIGVL